MNRVIRALQGVWAGFVWLFRMLPPLLRLIGRLVAVPLRGSPSISKIRRRRYSWSSNWLASTRA